ncbi:unnamed protein product [Spirodela intermedia]|uniref:X8 domain-containing protein n=1 Tax=Spirodela intermedia TaxID=51605 RepID=A0A7I8JVQ1_SPIIN|nr:unnamed protein product [Spirodela intermedia]
MAVLVVLMLVAGLLFSGADATWCVCRSDVGTSSLQKTLDYACGAGADCSAILQKGSCYEPNTVLAHCSWAANSYFQKKGQAAGSCDFSGTAGITTTDPSISGCSYPSSASSTTPTSTSTSPPGTTTTTSGTPTFTSPTTNGIVGGLGPTGTGISTDGSGAGSLSFSPAAALLLPALFVLRLGW